MDGANQIGRRAKVLIRKSGEIRDCQDLATVMHLMLDSATSNLGDDAINGQ